MNQLSIAQNNAEPIFKEIENMVKHPRNAKFWIGDEPIFMPKEYIWNKNANEQREIVNRQTLQFIDSSKVIVTEEASKTLECTNSFFKNIDQHKSKKDLSIFMYKNKSVEDFKPILNNYLLIIPLFYGNNVIHQGYWIRETLGNPNTKLISSLTIYKNNVHFNPIDWLVDKEFAPILNFSFNFFDLDFNFQKTLLKEFESKLSAEQLGTPHVVLSLMRDVNNSIKKDMLRESIYSGQANMRNPDNTPFYTYKVVHLKEEQIHSPFKYEISVNTNRYHEVIGFWRNYKSGKRVWVNPHFRGDKTKGIIEKDYLL